MAIQNKINLETRFQLNTTPNEIIRIKDTTDYASESIALADVIGALKITSPLGTVFHNTVLPAFDIDLDVQDYIDTIALPTDSNGDPLKGVYTVEYTIRVAGAVQPGDYTSTFTYNYCAPTINPDVDITVDLICSKLTSTDNTSYPTEVTSTTLTHSIHPPAGLPVATYPVQTVSTVTNVYTPITTKTWTATISNILELTYPATGSYSEHIIDMTVTGDSEKDIIDDVNICNLQCNMIALTSRYSDALQNNPIDAQRIADTQLTPALINAFMYTSNIECGNFDKAEFYYNEVLKFTGSSPDCACSDSSTPTLILASCSGGGSSNTYVVDVCNTNSALSVSSNTIGNETTYTICFDDTIWTKVNALTETDVTSIDASVTITSSLNGYTKTYDLSVPPAAIVAASPVHAFSGIIDIDLSQSDPNTVPALSWRSGWSSVWGNKLQEPTFTIVNTGAAWPSNPNEFYMEGYVDQAGGEFPKPQMQIVDLNNPGYKPGAYELIITQIDTANDRIYFQFVDENGVAPSGYFLSETTDSIAISVIINA